MSKRQKEATVHTKTNPSKRTKQLSTLSLCDEFKFKSFLNLLSPFSEDAMEALLEDCKTCFTCREVEDGDAYSLGSTFFIRANETPTCGIEALAKKIFELHTLDLSGGALSFDPANSGAEWWTQHIDRRDNIGFHWDRDYGLEEEEERHVHPNLGTVTYLSVINAGPTVFLDKRGTFPYGADISGPLTKCIISRPAAGKHITFDGELLHGAPSTLAHPKINDDDDDDDVEREDGCMRVTFLVNIWLDHCPVQSERLPSDIFNTLKLSAKVVEATALNVACQEDVAFRSHRSDSRSRSSPPPMSGDTTLTDTATTLHRWAINSSEEDYIIQVRLPNHFKSFEMGKTVECVVPLGRDSSIEAGTLTSSSSEESPEEDEDNDDTEQDDA
jgi:hypothetical protein